ncbi:MAG: hypothetical protein G01um101448_670 [Parcubacteria group bacterium Gr01-1014_48]|nr:MAG: hypothetical protein Greene041614_767 [Parcubacteria group bacterium Greene0416_14]TSC73619.1 MAG: hypothetical protein G01um101448_670 [Parcubacteria group bacterium Gr01-1014_48]TSD00897.1 MAG: hypothetical protein Greene101415_611 [Parcubacteria group bacterium Greene1014_15]TSD07978.1 MAG: hypothetical protein Greene07144_519 [Parcubacteria group bacterium Greene0714_4]
MFGLVREMRLSFVPPLMVYMAAGISGLTGIVGTFFVKDYLGLSPEFLAALGFWAGIPWTLKMPLGHLVDLFWRKKGIMVVFGAAFICMSLLIMIALIGSPDYMRGYMSIEMWFVLAALLSPVGYVVQDAVADGMTVDAVPTHDGLGTPLPEEDVKRMHMTMQTLGRFAVVGGSILVSLANMTVFSGVAPNTPLHVVTPLYVFLYKAALVIPLVSISGVALAYFMRIRDRKKLVIQGFGKREADDVLFGSSTAISPNWLLLGGSIVYVVFVLGAGFSNFALQQEAVFAGSLAIMLILIARLTGMLTPDARRTLIGTAVIIFIFRSVPSSGVGQNWWLINELHFNQAFLAKLGLIGSCLSVTGMFIFRRFMAEKSISFLVVFLSILSGVLALPFVGMFYGLHEWTANMTCGVVDARFIAIIDTAIESPFGEIAMIPMLAWIAKSAPKEYKATFFAVMASFTNLALSLSHLGTKYLNQVFTVTRQDFSELGVMMILTTAVGVALPILTVCIVKALRIKTA